MLSRTLTHEVQTPAHEVACGSHLGRVDVGARHQASPKQDGGLVRVDAVVLGLRPMNGTHVQSMTQDEGDPFLATQVRQPVPAVDALDRDDEILTEGMDCEKEPLRIAGQVPVQENDSLLTEDADVHRPRVQIHPAIVLVVSRVEVHPCLPPSSPDLGGCTLLPSWRAPAGRGPE
jgi:hypothetical protein